MHPREGAVPWLLTPSVLLPTQVASSWADHWLRRLCRAILEDALACLDGKGPLSNWDARPNNTPVQTVNKYPHFRNPTHRLRLCPCQSRLQKMSQHRSRTAARSRGAGKAMPGDSL